MGTYHLRTYGCQMNVADSERLSDLFQSHGLTAEKDMAAADFIILNTCSVRAKPENKVRGLLHQLRPHAQNNPNVFIGVIGCMAQLRPELAESFPFVNLVMGSVDFPALMKRLEAELELRDHAPTSPPAPDRQVKAFVPVVRGCSNRCAYCVVPDARGPERSRSIAEVVRECSNLADVGCVEITLLGQNVLSWGRDTDEGVFMDLLEAVHEIQGLERLSFLTSHPRDFTPDLPARMALMPKVCNYFHFPLQAGDDQVLARMGRGYTAAQYLERARAIREAYADAAISSDFIVGFPGESAEAFENTMKMVRLINFDWAYIFKYSVRPGTPAAVLEDDVSPHEKGRRHARLMELQDSICQENNRRMLGSVVQLFVDEPARNDDATMLGRTTNNKKVAIPADPRLYGRIVPVRITEALTWSLRGEPV